MAWFEDWFCTPYYAMLYGHRDRSDAAAWVRVIMERAPIHEGDQVLDMACGRGRHAAHLCALGVKVTGIDLSPASIADARKLIPEGHFEVHDMRVPFAHGRFDAVICLFTSLGYSNDRSDDQRAVNAAFTALKAGGVFVLDLLNGNIVRKELVKEESQVEGPVRFTIKRAVEGNDIVKHIHVEDLDGSHDFMERVHAWTVEEVRRMIETAGFALNEITDGPEPTPFDPATSERIVVWARKPIDPTRPAQA
jgi:SAM-dependent methyltransferase